jgi:phosphatidylinositol glycan class B
MLRSKQLWAILAIALSVRLAALVAFPSLHHPDENFQFLEQAHRIAFGYGIRPWEMTDGIRSMMLPYLAGKVFLFVNWVSGDRQLYIPVVRGLLALFSLLSVAAVYEMGLQKSRLHALFAGLVAATWFEFVFFSFRPLTEAMATVFLITALALATRMDSHLSRRRLVAIGFCISMCLMLRIHLAPGLLVVTFWVLRQEFWMRLRFLVLGGVVPLIVFGAADYLAWGYAFHSYWAAVRVNILENKASQYGVQPIYWFLKRLVQLWAGAFPFLVALIAIRWRDSRPWIITALVLIAFHSLIAHKEDRFVFPAHACLVIVAALATADLLTVWLPKLGADPALRMKATLAAVALWCVSSFSLAAAPGFMEDWQDGRQLIRAFDWLHDQRGLCGILLADFRWTQTGGYAYLHRDVPLYDPSLEGTAVTEASEAAYNFAVMKRTSAHQLSDRFGEQKCWGSDKGSDVCVVRRSGGCNAVDSMKPLLSYPRLGE